MHEHANGAMRSLLKPSEREAREITAAKTRRIARRPRLAVRVETAPDRVTVTGCHHADKAGFRDRLLDAMGTTSGDFACTELTRISSALDAKGDMAEGTINAALAVLDGGRPKDEIEAQLVAQMAVTHAYTMDLLGRSKRAGDIETMDTTGKLANRLLRTYAMQCDTLTALRRGGKQVVEVRHVYRDRRKPEGVRVKRQPQPRGPNGRWQAADAEESLLIAAGGRVEIEGEGGGGAPFRRARPVRHGWRTGVCVDVATSPAGK